MKTEAASILMPSSGILSPNFMPIIIPSAPVAIIPETVPARTISGYPASAASVIAVNWVLSRVRLKRKRRQPLLPAQTAGPALFLHLPLSQVSMSKEQLNKGGTGYHLNGADRDHSG